jgi:hypothetical protein
MISNRFLSMNTYLRERGRVAFTIKHLIRNALNNFVLNQIQHDATTFQKCKLITNAKMYLCRLHVNDNSPVNYLVTSTNRFHTNNTPFLRSNKRKKTKNEKGRRKRLDKMTSKNQMRRGTDFWCPSLEFLLSRIGEKKAAD